METEPLAGSRSNFHLIYLSKSDTTIFAFSLHLLPRITFCTYQLCERFSIEMMIFTFVVTISAFVELSAAGSLKIEKEKLELEQKLINTDSNL